MLSKKGFGGIGQQQEHTRHIDSKIHLLGFRIPQS
jgi:hypothetical protein